MCSFGRPHVLSVPPLTLSAQFEAQPAASFCFLSAYRLPLPSPGTLFLVVLHLASQQDTKPKASLHFSHIPSVCVNLVRCLPVSLSLAPCISILLFSIYLLLLSYFLYPVFLLLPHSSFPISCLHTLLQPPHSHTLISPPPSFLFITLSLSPLVRSLLFELKCCESEISL